MQHARADRAAIVGRGAHIVDGLDLLLQHRSGMVGDGLARCRTFEGRLGGDVNFVFDEENNVSGEVTVWNPYAELAHTWVINGEVPSSLSYLLQPEGSGTKMTLVHSKLPEPMANGYTPGWHAYLDRLDQMIAGTDPSSGDELFNAIAPQYMPQ